jgi:hypothetical protein
MPKALTVGGLLLAGYLSRRMAECLSLLPTCVLSIPSWLPDGRRVNGWLGERVLLGENELAGLRDTQQIFLPMMEYDDFPGALHEVGRSDPFPLWTRHR